MQVLISGYNAYDDYSKSFDDHRFKNLVKDLKNQLKDPNLSAADRNDLARKIASIENKGQTELKKVNMALVSSAVAQTMGGYIGAMVLPGGAGIVSNLSGSLGTGVSVLATHKFNRINALKKGTKIKQAKMVGGRRREQPGPIKAKESGSLTAVIKETVRRLTPRDTNTIAVAVHATAMAALTTFVLAETGIVDMGMRAVSSLLPFPW